MSDQNNSSSLLPDDIEVLKARIRDLERKVAETESVRESLAVSEVKYKTIIDNLKDVIFTHDPSGIVTYVTASVRQYGYNVSDILGHNMLEFVHPDDWQLSLDVHKRLIDDGGEAAFVIRLLTRDGRTRILEDYATTVANPRGQVMHTVGVLRDITQRREAEDALTKANAELEKYARRRTVELSEAREALKSEGEQRREAEVAKSQSEHLLAGTINFLPDPTFVINQDGLVMVWNRAMEALTGVKEADILGKGNYEYALPFYGQRRPILIDFALNPAIRSDKEYSGITQQGDTFIAEAYTPRLKNGQPTYLWSIAKPYYNAQGEILGAIESIRDVTIIHTISSKLNKEVDKFRALYDLAVNLSAEKSLDDNLTFIVEKSRRLMDTDVACIALVDEAGQYLFMHTLAGIRTDAFKRLRTPLDRTIGGMILTTRQGRVFNGYFSDDDLSTAGIIQAEGLESSMAVPICAADKSLGVLYVADRKKTEFSPDDLDTLLLFGNLAAVEIVRKRVENDLQETATKYRTVFETTGSAMVILEEDGIISLVNEEFARMTGFPKNEIEGKKLWSEFVVPEDIERLEASGRAHLISKSESFRQDEYRFQDRNGRQRNIFLTADVIPGTRKSVASLADITARRKVEEDLRKARAELESRVEQRTKELTAANEELKELLQKQDVNIDLAKNILAMINSRPSRHFLINDDTDLFFTAFYLPCYAEGGDHFFIKNFSERYPGVHKTTLSLKDQSGHEVSCILRSIITDLIHNALLVNTPDFSLEARITQLNKAICDLPFFGEHNFFTAINAEIDHANLIMRFVSAGHPPFLLIRGQDVACLPPLNGAGRNVPVGILNTIRFTADDIQLQKGDKLIFFTDGFTDIPHRLGEPVLNADDLRDMILSIVKEQPRVNVSTLMAKLFNRINGMEKNDKIINFQGFDDDITLLGLELEDHHHDYEDIIQPKNLDDFSSCVTKLNRKIKAEWQDKGFPAADTRLQMVLEEALTNAWKHGSQGSPDKKILVRRRYGNDAVLEVIDEGAGFDFETVYDPTSREHILQEHGRGNFIMRLLTEEVMWQDGGRHLITFFARESVDIHHHREEATFDLWKRSKKK